jgi:hypothetical protein
MAGRACHRPVRPFTSSGPVHWPDLREINRMVGKVGLWLRCVHMVR